MPADVVTKARPNQATQVKSVLFGQNVEYGLVSWVDPNNIKFSDSNSSVATISSGLITDVLFGREFNLNVPLNANVLGITFNIEKSGQLGVEDDNVWLVLDGVVQSGSSDTDNSIAGAWPLVSTSIAYGSITDNWGQALTPTLVNSPDFGVALSAINNTASGDAIGFIDNITATVQYGFDVEIANVVVGGSHKGGNYQKLRPISPHVVNISGYSIALDDRFDDTTYYTA